MISRKRLSLTWFCLLILLTLLKTKNEPAQGATFDEDAFNTTSIVLEDMDGDGNVDLLVGDADEFIEIYSNNGTPNPFEDVTGWIIAEVEPGVEKVSLAVGDVDGDGDPDIVAGYSGQPNWVYLLEIASDQTVVVSPTILAQSSFTKSVAVLLQDFNGDGKKDVVIGNSGQRNQVYLNDDGSFTDVVPIEFSQESNLTTSLAFGDLNGDGHIDIAEGVEALRNLWFPNNGTSVPFGGVPGIEFDSAPADTSSISIWDADGDGKLDVAMGNCNEPSQLFLNNGTPDSFNGVEGFTFDDESTCTKSMAWGDVNGDDWLDLILANCDQSNKLYLNNCTSDPFIGVPVINFGGPTTCTRSVALGDVDGDGDLDVAFGNFGGVNRLILNNGTPDNPFGGELSSPTPSPTSEDPATPTPVETPTVTSTGDPPATPSPSPTNTSTGVPSPTPTDTPSGEVTPTPTQTPMTTPTSDPNTTPTNTPVPTSVPIQVIAYTFGQSTMPGIPGKPGSPIPDLPGEMFRVLGLSTISSRGVVCFGAQGTSGNSSPRGIWTNASGDLKAAVIAGDTIADTTPPIRIEFTSLDYRRSHVINASGQVAFQSMTDPGGKSICVSSGRDQIRLIASVEASFPGDATYERLSQDGPLLDNEGNVAFLTTGNTREIWKVTPDDVYTLFASNEPAPGFPGEFVLDIGERLNLSGAGALAFEGAASVPGSLGLLNFATGIWADESGTLDLVVSSLISGGPFTELPDMPSGATPTVERLIGINDVDDIVFEGGWFLEDPGNNQSGQGLYVVDDEGGIRKIGGSTNLFRFSFEAFIQRNGNVIYSHLEENDSGEVMVFLKSEAAGTIYQTGANLPTIPDTVNTSLVSWVANNLGQVVFLVALSGEGIHIENDAALFLFTPEEGTSKILREGDDIEVDPLSNDTRRVIGFPLRFTSGPGRWTSFSDNGLFTTIVDFLDSSDGIIVVGEAVEDSEEFVVNSVDDVDDGECNIPHCSLREAINAANENPGLDTITFDLPMKGANPVIKPTSPLPAITESVNLDGTSQGGYQGEPIIVLDGSLAGTGGASEGGLTLKASLCTVRGFVINNFSGHGIYLDEGGFHTIQNCFIGTTPEGMRPSGNFGDGINLFDSGNNRIGGSDFAEGNTISGNSNGISIVGDRSSENEVLGNFIGLNSAGDDTIGNVFDGIQLRLGAHDNTIGGAGSSAGNVISGNGESASERGGWGIVLSGSDTMLNKIHGNVIGASVVATEQTGFVSLFNGNLRGGILIDEGASSNEIGGEAETANFIARNGGDGVTALSGRGNSIQVNRFYLNGKADSADLPIDLGGDGGTPNDVGDLDQGPNDLLNHVELEIAVAVRRGSTEGLVDGDSITVLGKLDVSKPGEYLLDVYVTGNCSDTRNYVGTVLIAVTAEDLSPSFQTPLILGDVFFFGYVVATLTDPDRNTSEVACGPVIHSDHDKDVRRRFLFGISTEWDPSRSGSTRLIGRKELTTLLEHWGDFPKGD